ncbi:aspartate aminotransferase family protein [Halopenitus persicus]|uniref:aspartate aminotransferase family protein n=1 Tax=Halopenitus persicus TaxID=1048396 RepID=UPI0012FD25D2|nr:aspartate aminotransferase family protein [Halopenitus persicus]
MPAVSRFIGEETPELVEGHGATVVDADGNEYVDFFAQHAAMSHGYSHPEVVSAVTEQTERLNFSAYDFPTEPSRRLTERLAEVAPGDLERSYFVNSGSEAVEVALTLARRATGNHEFLALGEAFHGRTYGARSLVGWSGYREGFGPFLPSVTHVPSYNCEEFPGGEPETGAEYADILEYVLEYQVSDVAAFIAEPMFGTAGNIPAPEGYFKRVKEICDDHGILFIADEVITGFGRTGKPFGIDHYDVEPDVMTTAKALGGGMPIGATIATPEVADAFESMDYFSTFGGNPVATAAGLASLDVFEDEDLAGNAAEAGEYLLDRLHDLQSSYPFIGEIRGRGLLIGVDLVDPDDGSPLAKDHSIDLRRDAIDRGLILPAGQGWNGNTIRINPPLVIDDDEIDRGVAVMDECFELLADRLA